MKPVKDVTPEVKRPEEKSSPSSNEKSSKHGSKKSKKKHPQQVQPVVKLQSPASSSSEESDQEARDQPSSSSSKSKQKGRSDHHLDAFLPSLTEQKEDKMLKALKNDLAAKAKQCLEKKKSVSELTGPSDTSAQPRVGESRERNIQIQQAKMASYNIPIDNGKGIEFTSEEATVPEEATFLKSKAGAPMPVAAPAVSSSSSQMKKDIHEILTTVGARHAEDSAKNSSSSGGVAVSLAKSTILSAVDSILKEKISGAIESAAAAVKARKSRSASRSRSRSRSRSHR